MTIPENWMVLTREEVADNPDLFDRVKLEGIDEGVVKSVRKEIELGHVEIYLRTGGEQSDFTDNVNVMKQVQRLPSTDEELAEICEALPEEFAKMFGRQIVSYECEYRTIADRKAIYLEFDGAFAGTRTMQYQIPRSKNITLIFSATSKLSSLETVRYEFGVMMESLGFEN